ncbi:unnamed protein product [Closterium sp. Naga37s-1]|nr:unnamed protein product [Closterium sp. Naga37s-1]
MGESGQLGFATSPPVLLLLSALVHRFPSAQLYGFLPSPALAYYSVYEAGREGWVLATGSCFAAHWVGWDHRRGSSSKFHVLYLPTVHTGRCDAPRRAAERHAAETGSERSRLPCRARMKRVGRGEGRGREAAIRGPPRTCFSARTAIADSSRGDLSRGGFVATAAAAETGGRAAGCDSIERITELIRRTHAPERDAHGSVGHEEGAARGGNAAVHEEQMAGPLRSLEAGRWVKLICGASFEDVADVRNLAFIYTLAGVDCIDCAAEPAVVAAARDGITAATAWAARTLSDGRVYGGEAAAARRDGRVVEAGGELSGGKGGGRVGGGDVEGGRRPWVMVSVSDGQDPHFRKAVFDASLCPPTCPRPCERVCPAAAIRFPPAAAHTGCTAAQASMGSSSSSSSSSDGVISERCYGCGRCIPVCPLALISAEEHQRTEEDTLKLLSSGLVDAIEIHTLPGHLDEFNALWASIGEAAGALKLVAVSLPDLGDSMPAAMHDMHRTMLPHLSAANLWQLDGRPMSGDIGAGATRAAVRLAARVAALQDRPPGYLQIAGGTNSHTFTALQEQCLLPASASDRALTVAGVAFGGHARKILAPVLAQLEAARPIAAHEAAATTLPLDVSGPPLHVESQPPLLLEAMELACALVHPYKSQSPT